MHNKRSDINCKEFDLVNKQTDANCCQLDCKLCNLFYFLADLIFCHVRRSIAEPWLASFLTNLLSSDYLAMKKEEEELLELAEERENETPDIESDARDIVEDEFDTEFWVKVTNLLVNSLNVYTSCT